MNKTLSITEWHHLASEGNAPPVRILLNGGSMYPLVRMNRDYVTIAPIQDELITGDLILFASANNDRYVVHRVWEVKSEKVLTWGDNCKIPDGWIRLNNVLGKVVMIERGKRIIHPNPKKGMLWAKFWHKIKPVYDFFRRIKSGIGHRIKKWKCEVPGEN